eukprot:snap_masked-scaffold_29-processed-gene-3.1-mRNA-1 protein AED:1.00 eAED:1.00 QI:0/0/0/0/1/1/2/0/62
MNTMPLKYEVLVFLEQLVTREGVSPPLEQIIVMVLQLAIMSAAVDLNKPYHTLQVVQMMVFY